MFYGYFFIIMIIMTLHGWHFFLLKIKSFIKESSHNKCGIESKSIVLLRGIKAMK